MRFITIIMLSLLFTSIANAELVCSSEKAELQVLGTDSEYLIKLLDLRSLLLSSVEHLKEHLPDLSDDIYVKMAEQAKASNLAEINLEPCSRMSACKFNSLESSILISCENQIGDVFSKFEVFQEKNIVKAKCVSTGSFEVSNSSVNGDFVGQQTQTYDLGFRVQDCSSEQIAK